MRRVLSLLLAVAVLAGCSTGGKSAPEPGSPAGPVKAMTHAEAQALAAKYRDEALTVTGDPASGEPTAQLLPCEGPHTFTAITSLDVSAPADQQAAVLQKLREHYAGAKYTVAPPSTDGSDHGALNVTSPERVMITIGANAADALRISVATPCYSSDEAM